MNTVRPRHPSSTTVACLIIAENTREGHLEYAAHKVIDAYFDDWTDERKADLYALLAESLLLGDTFSAWEAKCSNALWDNQNAFCHV